MSYNPSKELKKEKILFKKNRITIIARFLRDNIGSYPKILIA